VKLPFLSNRIFILTSKSYCSIKARSKLSIIGLALQTGLRRRELLLRWSHIDFEREVIHVGNSREQGSRTKSGRNRQVPMTSEARRLLEGLAAEATSEFVFCNPVTEFPYTDVKRAFMTACRKAEIVDLHFHDLRRTAATRLGDAGVDAIKLPAIMGWSDVRMLCLIPIRARWD
jgi:integrase